MHWNFDAGFQLSLLVAALASSCAAAALLLCEQFGSRRLARLAPAYLAAAFMLLAAGAAFEAVALLDRLSESCVNDYRDAISKIVKCTRSVTAKNESVLRASLDAVNKKLDRAESRLVEVEDDIVSALVGQIRELREQKQGIEAQLAAQMRIASASE